MIDLRENIQGCGFRILRIADRSSHHEDIGAIGDGGSGGGDTFLVLGGSGCRANSGGDEQGIATEGGSQVSDFFGGADEGANAGLPGHFGQALCLIRDGPIDTEARQVGGIEGSEDSDPDDLSGSGFLGGLDRSGEHGGAAEGMDGEQVDAEGSQVIDRAFHGGGDIVEFEVEEHVESGVGDLLNDGGAFTAKQFEADFGEANVFAECEIGSSIREGWEVEGEGEVVVGHVDVEATGSYTSGRLRRMCKRDEAWRVWCRTASRVAKRLV